MGLYRGVLWGNYGGYTRNVDYSSCIKPRTTFGGVPGCRCGLHFLRPWAHRFRLACGCCGVVYTLKWCRGRL